MASPIGSVRFEALGRAYTLKFGNRQRFRIEQEFGKGFAGVFLDTFPGVTAEMVASGDARSVAEAMRPQDIKLASIVVLFGCAIVDPVDDDDIDAMVEELGYEQITKLMGDAVAASSPKGAAADVDAGEAKAGNPAT